VRAPRPRGGAPRLSREAFEVLKLVALRGGRSAPVLLSSREVGEALGVSQQSASQYILDLDAAGLISRSLGGRKQSLRLTPAGFQVLQKELSELRRLVEARTALRFSGVVVSGLGEGKYYLSLAGYKHQFIDRLGYTPFPGTLNVRLSSADIPRLADVKTLSGIRIDGFTDQGRTFGGATCYPSLLNGRDCHLILPDRTHYQDTAELIAPIELRRALRLKDQDGVTMEIGTGGSGSEGGAT
jgi:riboflavin kinase, archaea type